jgi:hypothetical protein
MACVRAGSTTIFDDGSYVVVRNEAVDAIARPEASELALFGTGRQARHETFGGRCCFLRLMVTGVST